MVKSQKSSHLSLHLRVILYITIYYIHKCNLMLVYCPFLQSITPFVHSSIISYFFLPLLFCILLQIQTQQWNHMIWGHVTIVGVSSSITIQHPNKLFSIRRVDDPNFFIKYRKQEMKWHKELYVYINNIFRYVDRNKLSTYFQ